MRKIPFCYRFFHIIAESICSDYQAPFKKSGAALCEHYLHKQTGGGDGSGADGSQVFEAVSEFARAIGMVVLPWHKEQLGYILNTPLVPFLTAGQTPSGNQAFEKLSQVLKANYIDRGKLGRESGEGF